jgi:hypothetical protein
MAAATPPVCLRPKIVNVADHAQQDASAQWFNLEPKAHWSRQPSGAPERRRMTSGLRESADRPVVKALQYEDRHVGSRPQPLLPLFYARS